MSRLIAVLIIIAAVMTAGFVELSKCGGEAPGLRRGAIGVVDLSRVLREHKGVAASLSGLEQNARKSQEELDGLKTEIEQLSMELVVYAKGSPEYVKKEFELERKSLAFKQRGYELQYALDSSKAEVLGSACRGIRDAVAAYAEQHGLDAVQAIPADIPDLRSDPLGVLKWIDGTGLIWCNDELDITDAVITIVNGT